MDKFVKRLSTISIIAVSFIALASFALSFNAIMQEAIKNGVPIYLAWLVPSIIDGSIIVFAFSVMRAKLMKENSYLSWFLIVSATAVSTYLNFAHSPTTTPEGILVSVIPPLSLFFSFEALMFQLRSEFEKIIINLEIEQLRERLKNANLIFSRKQEDIELLMSEHAEKKKKANEELEKIKAKIEKEKERLALLKGESKDKIEEMGTSDTKKMIKNAIESNPELNKKQVAELLGLSPSTVYRYTKK